MTSWEIYTFWGNISLFIVLCLKKVYIALNNKTVCISQKNIYFPRRHWRSNLYVSACKNKNVNLGTKRRPSSRQVALIIVWLSLSTLSPNPTPPAERIETMASLVGLGSGTNWHGGRSLSSPSWSPRRQSLPQTGTSHDSHSQEDGSDWRLAFGGLHVL